MNSKGVGNNLLQNKNLQVVIYTGTYANFWSWFHISFRSIPVLIIDDITCSFYITLYAEHTTADVPYESLWSEELCTNI